MRCEPFDPPHSDTRRRPPTRPIPRKLEFVTDAGIFFVKNSGPDQSEKTGRSKAGFARGILRKGRKHAGSSSGRGRGVFLHAARILEGRISRPFVISGGGFWKEGRGVQEV